MILVPVKNLANAKQRLSPLIPEQSLRTELAQAMLADVLAAVSEHAERGVALVTSDPFAVGLANSYGFEVICDDTNRSETDAIAMATQACMFRGIEETLVIPADIPRIEADDIRQIFNHAPREGTVLVPAEDKRGTNAVLRRPTDLFPLRFGNDSFMPHLSAAINTNSTCIVLSLPRIGLDIDTPDDLFELADYEGEKRSQLLARKLIAASRPTTLAVSQ